MRKITFVFILGAAFCLAACGNNASRNSSQAFATETVDSCCAEAADTCCGGCEEGCGGCGEVNCGGCCEE